MLAMAARGRGKFPHEWVPDKPPRGLRLCTPSGLGMGSPRRVVATCVRGGWRERQDRDKTNEIFAKLGLASFLVCWLAGEMRGVFPGWFGRTGVLLSKKASSCAGVW